MFKAWLVLLYHIYPHLLGAMFPYYSVWWTLRSVKFLSTEFRVFALISGASLFVVLQGSAVVVEEGGTETPHTYKLREVFCE